MSTEPSLNEFGSGETLAPVADLQEYGARIIAELDKAEAELDSDANQPFSGMSTQVMRDIAELREKQFDMFRRHVEIEQAYKIQNAVADGNDVQKMSFSGIATTMRKKESATAGLLNQLAEFDAHLRMVMDKFEKSGSADVGVAGASGGADASTSGDRDENEARWLSSSKRKSTGESQ